MDKIIITEIWSMTEDIVFEAENLDTAIFAIWNRIDTIQEVHAEAWISITDLKRICTLLTAEESPYADDMKECIDDIERCLDTIQDECRQANETISEAAESKKEIAKESEKLDTYLANLETGNDIETIKNEILNQ